MSYLKGNIKSYLDSLGAAVPVPGGGSAAALVAALGVSLLLKSTAFTLRKKIQAEKAAGLKKLESRLKKLSAKLEALVDEDARAYSALDAVFKMPRNDLARKKRREAAFKKASIVLMNIHELAFEGLSLSVCLAIGEAGMLLPDVLAGGIFLESAMKSVSFTAGRNLVCVRDSMFRKHAAKLLRSADKKSGAMLGRLTRNVERLLHD